MDKQFQAHWRQAEAELRDMCEFNSAQAQILAASLRESELEHQQLHTAIERRLQLEAQALRRSQDLEQEALSITRQREAEVQQLQDKTDAQPQLLKEQWRQQMSQAATYKAEIHALHTEIANMAEKSELQATLSAKMCSTDGSRPVVEAEPGKLLNTAGPCSSPSSILPSQLMTPKRPTTRRKQIPTGAPVAHGPSPVTKCCRMDSPGSTVVPAQNVGQRSDEVRDLFQGRPAAWEAVDETSDDDLVDLT